MQVIDYISKLNKLGKILATDAVLLCVLDVVVVYQLIKYGKDKSKKNLRFINKLAVFAIILIVCFVFAPIMHYNDEDTQNKVPDYIGFVSILGGIFSIIFLLILLVVPKHRRVGRYFLVGLFVCNLLGKIGVALYAK